MKYIPTTLYTRKSFETFLFMDVIIIACLVNILFQAKYFHSLKIDD